MLTAEPHPLNSTAYQLDQKSSLKYLDATRRYLDKVICSSKVFWLKTFEHLKLSISFRPWANWCWAESVRMWTCRIYIVDVLQVEVNWTNSRSECLLQKSPWALRKCVYIQIWMMKDDEPARINKKLPESILEREREREQPPNELHKGYRMVWRKSDVY